MSSQKEIAAAAKARGNAAFTAGKYQEAVDAFTEAIQNDPSDAIFFSNRSGAYASLNKYEEALQDAEKCVSLKPDFVKGYSRKGVALFGLHRLEDAKQAYEAGLKLDPSNAALLDGLKDVDRAAQSNAGAGNPLGAMFGPDMWTKLMSDPVTKGHLADPAFVQKMNQLQKNPNLFGNFASDPKVSQALGVLFGLGANAFAKAAEGAGAPGDEDDDEEMEIPNSKSTHPPSAASSSSSSSKPVPTPEPKPQQPPRELTEEEKKRAEADKHKEKGNEYYKKKEFKESLEHYQRAIDCDPTNIAYYSNMAAAHFELKDYDKCIDIGKKGIQIGQEQMGSFKLMAKVYARVGYAYQAQKKYNDAIFYFEKSLVEDQDDKVRTALKNVQAAMKKLEQEAYLDPAKSEEHKLKGNELYNEGKYVDAIKEYTEALRRDPKNLKVYSNRANCYSKLMDWQRGLEDCEKCLELDPKFIKAYIRKGKIQHFLKQFHKALETFNKGLELEPSNTELLESKRTTLQAISSGENDPERAKEAMKDPEIQSILRDPTINKVLQDMQENPMSGQAALRDPDIRGKIEKLIAAGVLQVK